MKRAFFGFARPKGLNQHCRIAREAGYRLQPQKDSPYGDRILVDVQQIIPLPEATEYQVQLREKETEGRKQRAGRYDIRQKFWEGVVQHAREKVVVTRI